MPGEDPLAEAHAPLARTGIRAAPDARIAMGALSLAGRQRGRFSWLPMAKGWTKYRDFPAPQGETFQQRWKRERKGAAA